MVLQMRPDNQETIIGLTKEVLSKNIDSNETYLSAKRFFRG